MGAAMLGGGAAMVVAGAVLLVTSDSGADGDPAPAGAAPAPSTTTTSPPASTSTTAPAAEPSTTAPPPETPEEFFARFTEALASGDAAFLVERLHPATYERYERADCEAYLSSIDAPAAASEVLSVGPVETFAWTTDGLTLDVPGATTVRVRRTEDGDTFIENDVHVVIGDDGLVRWFTDCGTPREGAR